MISKYVKYSLVDNSVGINNVTHKANSLNFYYPCSNESICTPYKIELRKGVYKFECPKFLFPKVL